MMLMMLTSYRVVRGRETSPTFWSWLVDLIVQVLQGIKPGCGVNYITPSHNTIL